MVDVVNLCDGGFCDEVEGTGSDIGSSSLGRLVEATFKRPRFLFRVGGG